MTTTELDQAKAEAFVGSMVTVINDAALALRSASATRSASSTRSRSCRRPTSHEIAGAAGLQERYVREWLGAMAVARCRRVRRSRPARTGCRANTPRFLTRAAGPGNLAGRLSSSRCWPASSPRSWTCFRHGGGVPYSEYTEFHRLMAEDSGALFDAALIDGILAARARPAVAARRRHRRRRRRLRLRPRDQRDGRGLSKQPLRRLRLLRRRHRRRPGRGRGAGTRRTPTFEFAMLPSWGSASASTWSPPSTRSMTRRTRRRSWPASRRRCGRAASS